MDSPPFLRAISGRWETACLLIYPKAAERRGGAKEVVAECGTCDKPAIRIEYQIVLGAIAA
jgi:hypothetical protein